MKTWHIPLIALAIMASPLNANLLKHLKTFQAQFTQVVTSDEGQSITYKGHVYFKAPFYSVWHYTTPMQKKIYANDQKVIVIDDDLEQVSILAMQKGFDFATILKNAKPTSKDQYKTLIGGLDLNLRFQNNKLQQINYKDDLDNTTVMRFTKQRTNAVIPAKIFKYSFPRHYDVIQ